MKYLKYFESMEVYIKDFTNVVNKLNKIYNPLGIRFIKENNCLGFLIPMDLIFIENSLMYSVLITYARKAKFMGPIYICNDKGNEIKSIELLLPKQRKPETNQTRIRIRPRTEQEAIDFVHTTLKNLSKSHTKLSVRDWPKNSIRTLGHINKLFVGYMEDSYSSLSNEDIQYIIEDINESDNPYQSFNNIKNNIPKLWNILKKINNEIDSGSIMGEMGFGD